MGGTGGSRPDPLPLGLPLVLALTMGISAFAIPALGILSPFIVADLGLSRTQLGWVITVTSLVTGLSSPLAGRLADRLGGRRVVLLLYVSTIAGAAALAAAPTYLWLLLLAPIAGLANGANNPATNTVILAGVAPERRGLAIAIKQSGVQAGIAALGLTLPALALLVGWRGSLAAVAVVAAGGLALAVRVVPQDETGEQRPRGAGAPSVPAVRRLAVFAFLMGAGTGAVTSFLPLFAHESLGFTETSAGAAAATLALLGVVARIATGHLLDRVTRYARPLAVLALVAAASAAAFAVAPTYGAWALWAGVALAGCSLAVWNAVAMLAAVTVTEPGRAGAATGVVVLGFMGGMTTSPVAFGAVVDATDSYVVSWVAVAAACLLAAGWMLLWRRAGTDLAVAPDSPLTLDGHGGQP